MGPCWEGVTERGIGRGEKRVGGTTDREGGRVGGGGRIKGEVIYYEESEIKSSMKIITLRIIS